MIEWEWSFFLETLVFGFERARFGELF